MYTIYHNNRCGKSRAALAALEAQKEKFTVVDYLKNPPSASQIKALLKQLNMQAFDLIRKKEAIFLEQYQGQDLSNDDWIAVLAKHPILIERPIIVFGNKATIARSPEKIAEALTKLG
jgi:arsenate reductase